MDYFEQFGYADIDTMWGNIEQMTPEQQEQYMLYAQQNQAMQNQMMYEANYMNQMIQQNEFQRNIVDNKLQQIAYKEYNAMNRGKSVHYTANDIIALIQRYIYNLDNNNCITTIIRLANLYDNVLRHACMYTKEKITYLQLNQFTVYDNFSVPFYYCRACGRLYVPREIVPPVYM